MIQTKLRPSSVYVLIILIVFQGLSGILGGIYLVLDPSGVLLQMPANLLHNAPFSDYLIPGLILLIVLGIFPLVVVYGLWVQRRWAWWGALGVGIALVIWIGVEIQMVGYHAKPPLQVIYGSVGLIILALVLSPSVRRFFKEE